MFENRADTRMFLAGLARAVRRGELEVHAWCLMTTHFHLLVRSPVGQLSQAMRRIQNAYVRWFNRTRRRDGPLVGGRFWSQRVDTFAYRCRLVHYIDANPVRAGLCSDPREYPWCSAQQYVRGTGPRWLSRDWLEGWVAGMSPSGTFEADRYPVVLDRDENERIADIVAARLKKNGGGDESESLLGMASANSLAWMRRKAMLADGHLPGECVVAVASLVRHLRAAEAARGPYCVSLGRKSACAWTILHAGLRRQLADESFSEIARGMDTSRRTVARLCERHEQLVQTDEAYARIAAAAVHHLTREPIPCRDKTGQIREANLPGFVAAPYLSEGDALRER